MKKTEKKVVVVSGGLGGLGNEMCRAFLSSGYDVFSFSKNAKRELSGIASSLNKGGIFLSVECDVTNAKQIDDAINNIIKKSGRIDVCVHSASEKINRKKLSDFSESELRKEFEVSFFGGFNLFNAVIPAMKKQNDGCLIAITSASIEANYSTTTKTGGYSLAKYALKGLVREYARELAQFHIRAHAVAPSFMSTKMNSDLPERLAEFVREKNPMGKEIKPSDVAEIVLFLASGNAKSLTGLSVPVSFGEVMQL